MMPVRKLPKPTGKYAVAFKDLIWTMDGKSTSVRIYYPAMSNDQAFTFPWAPMRETYQGIAYFSFFPKVLGGFLLSMIFGNAKIAAAEGIQPFPQESFPVAVFSHGLAGDRNSYTALLSEWASRGWIIIAPEHSDGTAPAVIVNGRLKYYERPPIDPKLALEFRKYQLEYRTREAQRAILILKMLNEGRVNGSLLDSHGIPLPQEMFKGCLDMSQLVISGHSFGAGTAFNLKQSGEVTHINALILLDIWPFAIPDYRKKAIDTVPTFFLNAEFFLYDAMEELFEKYDGNQTVKTVSKAVHTDFSDIPYLAGKLRKVLKTGGELDPASTSVMFVDEILNFLAKHA